MVIFSLKVYVSKTMLVFQWGGDYHLNARLNQKTPEFSTLLSPKAPFLILTGDIFNTPSAFMYSFLEYCGRNWQKVFVVMGNQEYEHPQDYTRITVPQYGAIIDEIITMSDHETIMKTVIQETNTILGEDVLVWLTKTHYDIPETNIRLAGVTLWADDYKPGLWVDGVLAGAREKKAIQDAEHQFLVSTIESCKTEGKKLILASHFMPSDRIQGSLYGEYKSMNPEIYPFKGFCTPKEEMFTDPLLAWICGHVHHTMKFKIDGIPLYVNYTQPIAI